MSFSRITAAFACLPLLFVTATAASAQDKFSVTPAEHAACDPDAAKFCTDSGGEDELLACMKSHRTELAPKCKSVFIAGLKKRHLPLD